MKFLISAAIASLGLYSTACHDNLLDAHDDTESSHHISIDPGSTSPASSGGSDDGAGDDNAGDDNAGDDNANQAPTHMGGSGSGGDEESASHKEPKTVQGAPTVSPQDMHIGMLTAYCDGTWINQLILTGTPGRLSCLSVTDTDVLPAGTGFQYMIVLDHDSRTPGTQHTGYCPVGEYVIKDQWGCHDMTHRNVPAESSITQGCATYREWNEQGTLANEEPRARSGLVHVSKLSQGCLVELELHFNTHSSLNGSYLIEDTSKQVSCGISL